MTCAAKPHQRWFFFNIGNTRTAIAGGIPGAPQEPLQRFDTPQVASAWAPPEDCASDWRGVAACVVPAVQSALEARWPGRIHFIAPEDYPQIDLSYYAAGKLGADRLANCAAMHQLHPGKSVVAIDCGTAINTVCLTPDGLFRGGVIFPGRATAIRALARDTAQLPAFAVTAEHDFQPLGTDTIAGIRNGIDLGIIGAVTAIVEATRRQEDFRDATIWCTGGDAPFIVKYLPAHLQVEAAPVPLTHYGISIAASIAKMN